MRRAPIRRRRRPPPNRVRPASHPGGGPLRPGDAPPCPRCRPWARAAASPRRAQRRGRGLATTFTAPPGLDSRKPPPGPGPTHPCQGRVAPPERVSPAAPGQTLPESPPPSAGPHAPLGPVPRSAPGPRAAPAPAPPPGLLGGQGARGLSGGPQGLCPDCTGRAGGGPGGSLPPRDAARRPRMPGPPAPQCPKPRPSSPCAPPTS
jgi:hypothetical protein